MQRAWRARVWRIASRTAIALLAIAILLAWPASRAGEALVVRRDVGPPDAIVMLASHEYERLPAAADLARRFPSSVVLLTVPRTPTKFNCYRCSERRAWLAAEGVPDARVVELSATPVANTYGEALATRQYVAGRPIRRLVVVTSPYHTRRALRVFESIVGRAGVAIGVEPAVAYSVARPERWWQGEYDRGYVMYEWTGILYYRFKYGVPLG